MALYGDLLDAKAIVQGGNPNNPKARRFVATAIDRAMRRIVDAEVLASHVLQAREAERSAKRILSALKKRSGVPRAADAVARPGERVTG